MSYGPVIPLLGILPKKNKKKTYVNSKTCSQVFIVALFTLATRCLSADKKVKQSVVCQYGRILFVNENEILIHASKWIYLKDMLNKRIQSQKIIHCMIPFIWISRIRESDCRWVHGFILVLKLDYSDDFTTF